MYARTCLGGLDVDGPLAGKTGVAAHQALLAVPGGGLAVHPDHVDASAVALVVGDLAAGDPVAGEGGVHHEEKEVALLLLVRRRAIGPAAALVADREALEGRGIRGDAASRVHALDDLVLDLERKLPALRMAR